MKNKKFAWIMGIVLAASVMMTGCGSKETEATKTETESADAVSEETESEDTTDTEETTEDTAEDTEEETAEDSAESTAEDTETSDGAESTTFDSETASVAGWNLTVEDVQLNDSLENVSVDLGYTGVETSDFQKTADEGKTFCLIKMKIEKDGSKESIDWANMKVTDSAGNEYERMSDEFLTDLGMMRMPGNALNFGSNEGWIAFEINDNAEGLELNYSFESEEYHCTL